MDRKACLLANHGVIATGADLLAAMRLAAEVENLAGHYSAALRLGEVRILDDTQMQHVLERFRTYGQQHAADPDLVFAGARPDE
jgi:L-fuculose-phosphate aldolase